MCCFGMYQEVEGQPMMVKKGTGFMTNAIEIAQELGEVVHGSMHYRALFMVGLVLFLISLLINYFAQKIVMKFQISRG